jgi:hypothetical protein
MSWRKISAITAVMRKIRSERAKSICNFRANQTRQSFDRHQLVSIRIGEIFLIKTVILVNFDDSTKSALQQIFCKWRLLCKKQLTFLIFHTKLAVFCIKDVKYVSKHFKYFFSDTTSHGQSTPTRQSKNINYFSDDRPMSTIWIIT